jgi:membrane protein
MRHPSDLPPRWLSGALILGAIAVAWAIETPRKKAALRAGDPPAMPEPAPGLLAAAPVSPYRQTWTWWRQVLVNTYTSIGDDRLLAVAAGVVFYTLLAIFPAITAFVSFYGLFASYSTIGDHLFLLSYVLPAGALGIVQDQIARIVSNSDGKLSVAFAVGLCIALWSANAGIKAMIDALNVVEDARERRSFLRLNVVSLGFTLGAIAFLLVAVGAVVAFPLVMSTFGLGDVTSTATWLVRWPVMLVVVMIALSVLYRFGPSHDKARWRWFTPGIVFAALAWLAGSAGLSFYLSNFADYNATYGSLGAAIGLMIWMWLTTIVILVGAELDSEIDKMMRPAAAPAV